MKTEVDRTALRKFAEVHGVESPVVAGHTNGIHYVEELVPNGDDTVLHIFAIDGAEGPWEPPVGTEWMKHVLNKVRTDLRLPVKENASWAELSWEPDGLPEIIHAAVLRMEKDTDDWLRVVGLSPHKITGMVLLQRLQEALFGPQGRKNGSWFNGRMALAGKLRLETLPEVLRTQGLDITSDAPPPDYKYMDDLFQTKPGSWFVRIFDLGRIVMDKSRVVAALVESLPDAP